MFTDLKERKHYNKTIHIVPLQLKNKRIIGNQILVRLFKFDQESVTKHGVLDPNFVDKYSEEGKVSSKLDKINWRPEAVVIQISGGAKKHMEEHWPSEDVLEVGSVIDLDRTALNDRNVVFVDKASLTAKNQGFLKIQPHGVEMIHNRPPMIIEFENEVKSEISDAIIAATE